MGDVSCVSAAKSSRTNGLSGLPGDFIVSQRGMSLFADIHDERPWSEKDTSGFIKRDTLCFVVTCDTKSGIFVMTSDQQFGWVLAGDFRDP